MPAFLLKILDLCMVPFGRVDNVIIMIPFFVIMFLFVMMLFRSLIPGGRKL